MLRLAKMMKVPVAIFAAYAATGVWAVELNGEVLVGSGDNYEQWITEHEHVMVEFYAPWCGHCKKLEPEYTKAAKQLFDENIMVPLVKVDATEEANEASARKYEIQGFPTIKWFVSGQPSEYDGPREAQGIVDWVKSMTGPAVVAGEPTGEEKLSVTYYGEDASVFDEVAKANRKKANWFHSNSTDSKIVLKHAGEDAIEATGLDTQEKVEQFFKDNAVPLFGELNGETFGTYMENGNGLVWSLFNMEAGSEKETVESNRSTFTEVAKEIGNKFAVTWTNTVEFAKVLESMFGITEFPKVIVQTEAGAKKNYIYDGEMTKDAVVEYINKVKNGEVEPHLKSEPVPEDQTGVPVKTIVGKNLQEMVFTESKDVLLEVYAPWCGHCKKLEPEYEKVGKKVIKEGFENIIIIAKMDGTANDSPVDSIEWSGFPTMFYVKAGETEPTKYDGPRDAKGIWKWIKKNHTQADMIKAKIASDKAARQAEENKENEAPATETATEEKPAEEVKEAKEEL